MGGVFRDVNPTRLAVARSLGATEVIDTRERLARALTHLGFRVFPSQTNFLLTRPPRFPAEDWQEKLRRRKILVRWFSHPGVRNYLRITVGTDAEAGALLAGVRSILG